MVCQRCKSSRVADVIGKTSDMCSFSLDVTVEVTGEDGEVPENVGIGGGDYLRFSYCLDCGQIQGTFPTEIVIPKK